jgi:Arc/MetJ family transcription regulator
MANRLNIVATDDIVTDANRLVPSRGVRAIVCTASSAACATNGRAKVMTRAAAQTGVAPRKS